MDSQAGGISLLVDGDPSGQAWRLPLALGFSCVLHGLALFAPVFGTTAGSADSRTSDSSTIATKLTVAMVTYQGPRLLKSLESPPPPVLPEPTSPVQRTVKKVQATSGPGNMEKADLVPLPGVIYYPTSLLSVRPQPQTEAELDPPRIRPIVASGRVILVVWVNPLGQTVKVAVESSDLPNNFVTAAAAAFEQLRFSPGELHGLRVGSVMRVEVTYDDGRLIKTEISE
jgi:hypothetical protein